MGGRILTLESEKILSKGITQGENKLSTLIQKLISVGRNDEIAKATSDCKYKEKLYKEFKI